MTIPDNANTTTTTTTTTATTTAAAAAAPTTTTKTHISDDYSCFSHLSFAYFTMKLFLVWMKWRR
jgi:hypothetical protein